MKATEKEQIKTKLAELRDQGRAKQSRQLHAQCQCRDNFPSAQ